MSLQVKRELWSSRRNAPEVRFEISTDNDVYEKAFRIVGISYSFRKITARLLCKNEEMDHLLGHKWNVRVKNKFGDYEFVVEGTFCFWMKLRPPLDDFVQVGDKFLPYKFQQEPLLIVCFVREIGNSRKYREVFRI